MSKKAYIGVDNVARKVKKGYLGIDADIPIYSEEIKNVDITADNISEYFDVTNGTYYFSGSGSTFTTNNGGVNSSTASTVLTAKQDISALSFNYSYSSEANYDKFTLKVGGATVENAVSGSTTSKSYIGSLVKGQTIELTYAKDSSQNKNDDQCTFSAMSITANVKTQIGAETKSFARKIKKAYIGIGGVARPCWSGGELSYYGVITPLSSARYGFAATNHVNYALFAGGYSGGYYKGVDAYNKELTLSSATDLSVARDDLAAASIGQCSIFAGGHSSSYKGTNNVDAYDVSLTRSTLSALSSKKMQLSGASNSKYALFAGGYYISSSDRGTIFDTVDAYDENLTKTTADRLPNGNKNLSATSFNGYALFGGGENNGGYHNDVVAYDENLTQTILIDLSTSRSYLSATSNDNFAIFGGGLANAGTTNVVDAYDKNFTRTTPSTLSEKKKQLAATSVGSFSLFGGGYGGLKTVDAYDENLTKTEQHTLSDTRQEFAATSIGSFALFGGGLIKSGAGVTAAVDAYVFD